MKDSQNTVPNFFYTDVNGQKQGAISPSQLKELVAQGIITPDTLLETDTGHKGKAGQIKGLFDVTLTQPAVPKAKQAVLSKASAPVAVPVASSQDDDDDYNYRRIALNYRWSFWSIILYLLLITAIFIIQAVSATWYNNMPSGVREVLRSGAIVSGYVLPFVLIFSIVCMACLAQSLQYGIGMIIFFSICILSGHLLGWIPMKMLYYRTVGILEQDGYKLGFWGNIQQFDDDGD